MRAQDGRHLGQQLLDERRVERAIGVGVEHHVDSDDFARVDLDHRPVDGYRARLGTRCGSGGLPPFALPPPSEEQNGADREAGGDDNAEFNPAKPRRHRADIRGRLRHDRIHAALGPRGEEARAAFIGQSGAPPDPPVGDTERDGLSLLKGVMEKQNYVVKPLVLTQVVPADATAIVIAGADKPFLESEVKMIADYVGGGGRLMLMQDPGTDPGFGPLLEGFGAAVRRDVVIDKVSQLFGGDARIPMVAPDAYDTIHPITKTFGYQTVVRGNTVYIQYIPRTLNYVRANLAKYPRFARLRGLLAELVEELR